MDVRAGPYKRLSTEELMLLNCGVGVPWTATDQTSQGDAEVETPILWPSDAKN